MDTAIARCRDAVKRIATGKTDHPSIDVAVLSVIWPSYKVTSDGEMVVICSRMVEQGLPTTVLSGSQAELAVLQTTQFRFVDSLTAFAVLLGQRLLQGEVTIVGELTRHP